MSIRGDRRNKDRKKERRVKARTPGRFKDAVDAVFIVERKKESKAHGTNGCKLHKVKNCAVCFGGFLLSGF